MLAAGANTLAITRIPWNLPKVQNPNQLSSPFWWVWFRRIIFWGFQHRDTDLTSFPVCLMAHTQMKTRRNQKTRGRWDDGSAMDIEFGSGERCETYNGSLRFVWPMNKSGENLFIWDNNWDLFGYIIYGMLAQISPLRLCDCMFWVF